MTCLGAEECIRSGRRKVKGAVEPSGTGAAGPGQTLSGTVLACRTGRAALHRPPTWDRRITMQIYLGQTLCGKSTSKPTCGVSDTAERARNRGDAPCRAVMARGAGAIRWRAVGARRCWGCSAALAEKPLQARTWTKTHGRRYVGPCRRY